MVLGAEHIPTLQKFPGQLDSGKSGTGNRKGQQPSSNFRVGLFCRFPEAILYVSANSDRIFQRPQREAVFLHTGNIKELRRSAGGNDQIVIRIGRRI